MSATNAPFGLRPAFHPSGLDRAQALANGIVSAYANDILLLIADKRLCRAIVSSSPGTALSFFQEIGDTKKYGVRIETFSQNIFYEALVNKDSFLYHEADGYQSGLIGFHKPLSQAMFANYSMVETIGAIFDVDIYDTNFWDEVQKLAAKLVEKHQEA